MEALSRIEDLQKVISGALGEFEQGRWSELRFRREDDRWIIEAVRADGHCMRAGAESFGNALSLFGDFVPR